MIRSMSTAISGLKSHQAMLDVTANNIANVNTSGFKGSRVAFSDLLSQTISGASQPTGDSGGINARQVGLGTTIGSTQQLHTQGGLMQTGVVTDLAISGDGFFRVTDEASLIGAAVAPFPTISYQRAGNFTFDRNGDMVTSDGYKIIGFAEDAMAPGTPDETVETVINVPTNATGVSIGQDGMVSYRMSGNPTPFVAGWITLAKFPNPGGMQADGNNKWVTSDNSGTPTVAVGGDVAGGTGKIASGYLEGSNVDLATEFTEMIKAQRGFQANSRTITTSDEILQELVNLKR